MRKSVWQHSTAADGEQFGIIVPNTKWNASMARHRLMGFVRKASFDAALTGDIQTAVGEALANAAEHGCRPSGTIYVGGGLTDEGVEITVTDDGPGFTVPEQHIPSELPERGYGFLIMQSVTDEFAVEDGGRTIRFLKRFAALAEAS